MLASHGRVRCLFADRCLAEVDSKGETCEMILPDGRETIVLVAAPHGAFCACLWGTGGEGGGPVYLWGKGGERGGLRLIRTLMPSDWAQESRHI